MKMFLLKLHPFISGLKFFIFVGLFHFSFGQQTFYDEKTCGVLYSQDNFSGEEFQMRDGDQSTNLFDEHRASSGWNSTGSVDIASGCRLKICNETYFDGACQTLEQGSYRENKSLDTFGGVASVRCLCKKECKCSDIFMKKSSCARGYLKGGCNTCHTPYTDLIESESDFPDEFFGKVEAFRLRKGCTLKIYPEKDFDGEQEVITDEIFENFTGIFHSYECECNDKEYIPRSPSPPSPSLPPLINVPSSVDDIIKLLTNENFSNHPGLLSALQSIKNGRSSKNAYILLLGSTGSGKSSAINLLFDNPNVTKVGDVISTTTNIHEFRIPIQVDELGIANSELRIIDTPGLCDTRGVEQDAKFLATLDTFLSSHEELKDRIPNVVLIFHKFSDNRFGGPSSNFIKMLRGLDGFREKITDENYSNIIYVLSHFCSEKKATVRKPEVKLNLFKKAIQDFSLFPRPILINVAENEGKAQYLPMVNGYFKLPNNEYYPRNLFEKLELVTNNGGDLVGQAVFRTAFRNSENFNISSTTFPLHELNGPNVLKYLRLLSIGWSSENNTEISQILERTWDQSLDPTLKTSYPESLQFLQRALKIRNINAPADIPRTNNAIVELLAGLKHDDATKTLLETGLNIKAPNFLYNPVAGYSYNVFRDARLPTSPFQQGTLHQTDIGFLLPKVLTCKLEQSTAQNFEVFDDMEKYVEHRLKSLGIEGNIAQESFKGNLKPGYNIKNISFRNGSCILNAVKEFRLFEFILNNRPAFTTEFENEVKSLPAFNASDFQNVEKWNDFFNDCGTHVVRSVHGGGAIEIWLQSDHSCDENMGKALFDLVRFAEDMSFMIVDENNNETRDSNRTIVMEGIQHSLSFLGGDIKYHVRDLTALPIEEASKLLTKWKKSLRFNPTVLSTEMKLLPISQVVKKLGQNYSSEIERATSLLFNSSLKYVPQQKLQPPRDETPLMAEVLENMRKSTQQIEELMKRIRQLEMEAGNLTRTQPTRKDSQSGEENTSLRSDLINKTLEAQKNEADERFEEQMIIMRRQREEQRKRAEEQTRRMLEMYRKQTENQGIYTKQLADQLKNKTENRFSATNAQIEMIRRKHEEEYRAHQLLMKQLARQRCHTLREEHKRCRSSHFSFTCKQSRELMECGTCSHGSCAAAIVGE